MLAIKNTDSDLKVHALHYAYELLIRVSFPFKNFCKLAQHAIRKHYNKKTNIVWEKRNEAYPLSIRVQTTKPHFDLFLPGMNVKENVFFSSEREFKKALRDTLMRAAWYELLSTMANCGKIQTFLSLGISKIT